MTQEPYGLDDLVAHEKRNLRLVAAVFVAAVGFYALRGRPASSADRSPPAPVDSSARR
jgi:hypothetical protein